ncbi:MAG: LuxR C-terminal-related transcriptional regulator [Pararhodobacter sp.]
MILERRLDAGLPDAAFPAGAVQALIGAIGTPGFIDAGMSFARASSGASFISVFCQGDRDQPLLVGTACTHGLRRATRAAKGYERHSGDDGNTALLAGLAGAGDFLTVQDAGSIASFTYRRDCYELPGIASRISLVRRRAAYGLAVSLYSGAEDGPLDPELYDLSAAVLGVVLAATERHVAFTLSSTVWHGQDIQARLALSYPALTPREREVAAMTIKGRTAAEIGAILGLSETTVITHRKKAYRRMQVRSLRQLMATLPGRPGPD